MTVPPGLTRYNLSAISEVAKLVTEDMHVNLSGTPPIADL